MTGSIEKEFKVRHLINSLIYHFGCLRRDIYEIAKEFKELPYDDITEILNRLEKDLRIIDDMIEKPPIKRMEGGRSWLDCGKDK